MFPCLSGGLAPKANCKAAFFVLSFAESSQKTLGRGWNRIFTGEYFRVRCIRAVKAFVGVIVRTHRGAIKRNCRKDACDRDQVSISACIIASVCAAVSHPTGPAATVASPPRVNFLLSNFCSVLVQDQDDTSLRRRPPAGRNSLPRCAFPPAPSSQLCHPGRRRRTPGASGDLHLLVIFTRSGQCWAKFSARNNV